MEAHGAGKSGGSAGGEQGADWGSKLSVACPTSRIIPEIAAKTGHTQALRSRTTRMFAVELQTGAMQRQADRAECES